MEVSAPNTDSSLHLSAKTEFLIDGKYRLVRKIGSGSFADIYLGINITNGEEVAIKLESVKTSHPQLSFESKLYKILQGGIGIPRIRYYAQEKDYNVLVMDLLGPSLEDLFNFCSRRFTMKTVLMLADQMIGRIEFVHNKNFIHRDIKPDNFLMGIGRHCNKVFLINFGLAKKYRDNRTQQHIPYREDKNLTGGTRYASITAHLGIEQSRRDDMESLGYVLMYFNRGSLPWQGLKGATKKQEYEKISEKKMSTPVEILCKGFPAEFAMYLNYCRGLRFEEAPDYMYLRQLFRILFRTLNRQYDCMFDWMQLKQKISDASPAKPNSSSSISLSSKGNVILKTNKHLSIQFIDTSDSSNTSPFYNACRENDISTVEEYLKSMSLEDVDRLEPNGSTALHVAAYEGHEKIVELLLKKGAACSIKNKYDATPLDQTKSNKIKQLIRRRMNHTRFVSDSVEWILKADNADYQAHEYLKPLESYGKHPRFYEYITYIKQNFLEKDLRDIDDIDMIKEYFDKAINEKNPIYLLIAYTAETNFYSILNIHLAKMRVENLTAEENLKLAYYIGIIARHPNFDTLSYTGVTYRGMMVTADDIKQYTKGARILTKTFSSSSVEPNVALRFMTNDSTTSNRSSTLCIYEIRNPRTALDIRNISMFPDEEEVLILPYSAFKIKEIKTNYNRSPRYEINLQECDPW
ncbi:unnamed protein product [Adineta ricciae]|uniref:NAD(P)(+)--arginine ADP-ribosyltransferase n=1 Tax=Adineta ricciae TaxID=249248 RepID=A0A813VCP8_ADIRI|nr:unnamed protein product [Adineta ricciae]